jgi:predicted nucleotide-binding protein
MMDNRAQGLHERVIAADPNNADALTSFANLCADTGQSERAQELYERAIAADPASSHALTSYGNFLKDKRKDYNGAQKLYERAIAADPNSSNAERIRSTTQLPRMFIGCSSESLQIAQYLKAQLRNDVESGVWDQGVFGLGGGTLEDLAEEARRVQFAALVLAPDDVVIKHTREGNAPRDNVLFEAGFFMGFLGRKNTFLVWCEDDSLELPSDLGGVTFARYRRREPPSQAMIGPAATRIREAVAISVARGPAPAPRAAFEEPRNGSSVEHRVSVSGRVEGLAAGAELWAAVAGRWSPTNYHPQGDSVAVVGAGFSGHVYVGNEDSTGSFRLLLLLVDNADGAYFRRYQAHARAQGHYAGLPRLPPSAKILDEILVARS